jgi:pyridoxamine 5'-phosphate oxidase
MYLKELDERGWVIYSNWGSKAGKGAQVFGTDWAEFGGNTDNANPGIVEDGADSYQQGNRWAALTFHWRTVERQVRVEGLVEPLPREASETYWRTRERASQIGAWASQQSKVLWSTEPQPRQGKDVILNVASGAENINRDDGDDEDDGRSILENRVREMEARFACTEEIPLPPFWGGVRIVPESVEFWQGRMSRLHDRFRYVRVHDGKGDEDENEKRFRWQIQRLSP